MIIYLIISALVVGLDQLLKWYIFNNFSINEVHNVIPNILSLTFIKNDGAANNILSGQTWLFYVITIIIIPVLIYLLYRFRKGSWVFKLGISLILAGAIGNFIDRIHLKYVIDMLQLDFMRFNIFNIADSAVTVGVALLFIFLIFIDRDENGKN